MMEATEQDVRTFSQTFETQVETLANLVCGKKDRIVDMTFDIPMTELFGIEFRRISR